MSTTKDNIAPGFFSTLKFPQGPFDGQNSLIVIPRWLQNTAFACLCIYVYSWYLLNDFADIFSLLLVIIGTYYYLINKQFQLIWKDPIILLFIAALLIQAISWYLSTQHHPEWATSSPKVHQMGIWFKMIPIAVILGARADRVLLCGFLAVAAVLSAPFVTGDGINELQQALSGKRIDFGINNAQHTAMIAGVLFIGLLTALFAPVKLSLYQQIWLRGLISILLFAVSATIIFTQTRAVILGVAVSIPILFIALHLTGKKSLKSITTGLLVTVIILAAFQGTAKQRFAKIINNLNSGSTISQTITNDNSAFLRLLAWEQSIEWIGERPLFGWGSKIEKHIVIAALDPEKPIPFGHLHNSYLGTLAKYGLAGFSVLVLLCLYLAVCAHKSWRGDVMPTPIYVFLVGFLPFWLTVNMFESYFYYSTGEYVLAIVGGIILSYFWRLKKPSENKP